MQRSTLRVLREKVSTLVRLPEISEVRSGECYLSFLNYGEIQSIFKKSNYSEFGNPFMDVWQPACENGQASEAETDKSEIANLKNQ